MTPVPRQLAPPGDWHPAGASRIPPIQLRGAGLRPRLLAWALGLFVKGDPPGIFLVLMRHWRLFRAWLSFAARLMPFGTLDRRDTELAILRVGWNCRCRYEWGQHVAIGLRVGLTPQQVARVAQGADAPGWEPRHAALLRATDELHHARILSADTWQDLAAHYDDKKLLELCLLIGHYEMLAGTLRACNRMNRTCVAVQNRVRQGGGPSHGDSMAGADNDRPRHGAASAWVRERAKAAPPAPTSLRSGTVSGPPWRDFGRNPPGRGHFCALLRRPERTMESPCRTLSDLHCAKMTAVAGAIHSVTGS